MLRVLETKTSQRTFTGRRIRMEALRPALRVSTKTAACCRVLLRRHGQLRRVKGPLLSLLYHQAAGTVGTASDVERLRAMVRTSNG